VNAINEIIISAKKIVIIQADNPDGDSLASALALEQILGDLGKNPVLYCGVEVPGYLKYMKGWDRIVHSMPKDFDASIIVDTSAVMLLEMLEKTGELAWIRTKPCIVIDHHKSEPTIDFAKAKYIEPAVATTELVYELAKHHSWPINISAGKFIVMGILSDSLGLISESTTVRSIRAIAELVEKGVSLAEIDSERKVFQKKAPEILEYKGRLLQRVKYSDDGEVATIIIPWSEIEKYSHMYNPSMLVLDEMRQVEGVKIAIALKTYPDKRVTGKVRANFGYKIADKLAEAFGGGGHSYASGFRVTDGSSVDKIQETVVKEARKLLEKIDL
jgi:bifunctional oligoribonuclease and PAP phosphatase NrnA